MMDFIVALDYAFTHYLNQFAGYSPRLDILIGVLTYNNLIKTGLMILVLNWAWFKLSDKRFVNRTILVATFFSITLSILVARLIATYTPFRYRPEFDPKLEFVFPYNATPSTLDGWSSFPSDHAAMYFALSVGICFISKKVGLLAILFATLFISFSRIYMGHHFLSDVVAGAVIGIVSTMLSVKYLSHITPSKMLVRSADSSPEYFYPLFILFMALLYDMFWGIRDLVSTVRWVLTM